MTTGPRMSLAAVTSTRQPSRPLRIALFGVPGVGKTTFAAQAPAPIFLCAEDGAGFLDAQAFPKPSSWGDVLEAVQELMHGEHSFKTLVIDTLDALEALCWEHVCKSQPGKNKSIGNRERFLRRYKEQIKDAVKRAIDGRGIRDIERGEEIRIPKRDISEPVFGHGQGDRETIGHSGSGLGGVLSESSRSSQMD